MKAHFLLQPLIAVTLVFSSIATKAADLKMEVLIAGHTNYVLVVPGSNTGGRVLTAANGTKYTDRVQRGELMRLTLAPVTWVEWYYPAFSCQILNETGVVGPQPVWNSYTMPTSALVRASTNVAHDNLHVRVYTVDDNRKIRIPIGSR